MQLLLSPIWPCSASPDWPTATGPSYMEVRSWDGRHQSSAFSKFITHVRMSIPVYGCFLQVLGQPNDRGQIAVQGTVTVISVFAVTMWCAWSCRGAREMNIQYMAQALCLINKYLMILSTTRAVFDPRLAAGRRKTKARELTKKIMRWPWGCQSTQSWVSFFYLDECSRILS